MISTTRSVSLQDGLRGALLELLPLSAAFSPSLPRKGRPAFLLIEENAGSRISISAGFESFPPR